MWLRIFVLWLCALPLLAGPKEEVFDLFTKIASELSADNPLVFLDTVDHTMPHYADFQNDIMALAGEADITNSIEVLDDQGDDNQRTEELDWFMQIVSKADSEDVERRRGAVTFRLEKRGKKWKIVSIDPVRFFAPRK
jgi:hypothetical protein